MFGWGERLVFTRVDGEVFWFYHDQDCCETVFIEDITGNLGDLVGEPMLMAEEASCERKEVESGTQTWTFYKFATNKGYVTVRWCGASNGYYSEKVAFGKVVGDRVREIWPFEDEDWDPGMYIGETEEVGNVE